VSVTAFILVQIDADLSSVFIGDLRPTSALLSEIPVEWQHPTTAPGVFCVFKRLVDPSEPKRWERY
jgi:hypothetical protein